MRKAVVFVLSLIILFLLKPTKAFGDGFETFGDTGAVALPLVGGGMAAAKKNEEGIRQFAKSYATTMATTYLLKHVVNSERPNGGRHSFPSGHTASAFAGASFIQQRYGWRYGGPAYVMATLVGISRITSHEHHPVDVICGAGLGIYIHSLYAKKEEKKKGREALTPLILPANGAGVLSLTYSW